MSIAIRAKNIRKQFLQEMERLLHDDHQIKLFKDKYLGRKGLVADLFSSLKDVPIEEILRCKNIGISSGASAPEILVDEFIDKIREKVDVEINEVGVAKENIVFKIPKKLM